MTVLMKRVCLWVGCMAVLMGCGNLSARAQNLDPKRPNLVIIYADDMGFGDMGAYGKLFGTKSPSPTPNMDQLAAEGMLFTHAHSSSAVCTPSRYALLTGKYNWRTFDGISSHFAEPDIPESDITIAEALKTRGYDTAAFGKWHLGGQFYRPDGTPYTGRKNAGIKKQSEVDWERPVGGHATDNGFDIFRGLAIAINFAPYVYLKENRMQIYDKELKGYRDALNSDSYQYLTSAQLAQGLKMGSGGGPGLGDPSYKQIKADPIMLKEAEVFLAARASDPDPFFAYVSLYSPHKPWHTTTPFKGKVGFTYGDWMAEVDHRIGRVIKAIDENGLGGNTVVVLTSDNGPENTAFTDSHRHGRDSNGPLRGIKRDVWEGGTRVPFVVRWPGQVAKPGSVSDELIWQGDIFATIADFSGVDMTPEIAPDGESLLPILRGEAKPAQRRDAIVESSGPGHLAVTFTDGWKLIDSSGGGGIKVSYDSRNKKITNATGTSKGTPKQLFFLPDDPGENKNLIKGITDEQAIREKLVALTGRDLLARLDTYRTTPTSVLFPRSPSGEE